jgi:hypothetical protein
MNKLFATLGLLALSAGIITADEINGTVKKIDGTKITIEKEVAKGSPKDTKGEEVTLTTADTWKIASGTFNKKAKTYTAGEDLTGGLQNAAFSAKKGAKVHVTTNSDNKVTEILVITKKKKTT